ncbi:UNVERIFIED_CONTAM: hypothetical protein K2H54_065791 [Gekko kuhli]
MLDGGECGDERGGHRHTRRSHTTLNGGERGEERGSRRHTRLSHATLDGGKRGKERSGCRHMRRSTVANAAKSVVAAVTRDAQWWRTRRRARRPLSHVTLDGIEHGEDRGGRRHTRRSTAANAVKSVAAAVTRDTRRRRMRRRAWRPPSHATLDGGERGEERGGCHHTRRSHATLNDGERGEEHGGERGEEYGSRRHTRRSTASNAAKSAAAAITRDARRPRTQRRARRPPSHATLDGGEHAEECGGCRFTQHPTAANTAKSVAAAVTRDTHTRHSTAANAAVWYTVPYADPEKYFVTL